VSSLFVEKLWLGFVYVSEIIQLCQDIDLELSFKVPYKEISFIFNLLRILTVNTIAVVKKVNNLRIMIYKNVLTALIFHQ